MLTLSYLVLLMLLVHQVGRAGCRHGMGEGMGGVFKAVLVGSLTGALVRSKVGAVQILFFTSMPSLPISGGSWPSASMPAAVRRLALFLPSTHIMTGYRLLALEGAGFREPLPTFL